MYKESDINKLIEELDIVSVIGEYVTLKKTGTNYKGLSPFQEERTPSFVVSPSKKIFKDFSSGIGGNVISFYMKVNNLTFIEAVKELSSRYNINISEINSTDYSKPKIDNKYYDILNDSSLFFIENFKTNKEIQQYLLNRGLKKETIVNYKLGYSNDKWNELENYLLEKGYKSEDIEKVGLIKKNDTGNTYDVFRKRVMFPIENSKGQIIAFGGRIITNEDNSPKYVNSPETVVFKKSYELYGLVNRGNNIKKKGYALLMEGYMDVLASHNIGFNNAVASLGTSLTEEQVKLIKRYTNNVVICYDSDLAGMEALVRASYILKKYEFNLKVFVIKNAKDPDELILKYGKEVFLKQLKQSVDIFDYLYDFYKKQYNLDDVTGKLKFVNNFKPFFANLKNKIEIETYLEKLHKELDISRDILNEDLIIKNKTSEKKNYNNESKNESNIIVNSNNRDTLEKETIQLLVNKREYLKHYKDKTFYNIFYKTIFDKLLTIDFDLSRRKEIDLSQEEQILLLNLQENSSEDFVNFNKEVFKAWFKKDIEEKKMMLSPKSTQNIILDTYRSEIDELHTLDELEAMYNKFSQMKGDH